MTSGGDSLGWIGATIDERYLVEEVAGEGGFGIVYKGQHLALGEPVAIKCLRVPAPLDEQDRKDFLRDFRAEARTLHRLSRQTAGIVQALDVGAATSERGTWTPYIVMEWLEGHTLEEEMRAQKRAGARGSVRDAMALLAPAARALGVAHASGVAHLDVKPANLFLTTIGGEATVKVLDFGIARAFSGEAMARALTRSGASLHAFTPAYAAPEQFHVQHGKPGAPTDVFALALLLLELASGKVALAGTTPLQMYMSAANPQLRPSFASLGVGASEALEAALRRALEVEPSQRYPDAGAMWRALEQALAATATLPSGAVDVEPTAARRESLLPGSSPATMLAAATRSTSPVTGENRIATILFAELVGTATLARHLDAEDVNAVVERVAAMMDECVAQAGGMVHEHVGDAVVAAFGLRSDTGNVAERAVHAALAMQRALAELRLPQRALGAPLRIRAGVHTGRVFLSMMTSRGAARVSLTGTPLTLASRLQQAAGADGVLVGSDTYRQLRGAFELEPVALAQLGEDGIATTAYRVVGITPGDGALRAIAGRDFLGEPTRFVGRAGELERIAGVAGVVAGETVARAVVVAGAPGVGKSRLLLEAAERLEERGFALFAAAASGLYLRTSYALAARLVASRFDIREDDDPARAEAKLRAGLGSLAGTRSLGDSNGAGTPRSGWWRLRLVAADDVVEPILHLLGRAAPLPSRPDLTSKEMSAPLKQRIGAAFAALIAAARMPVALVADDVHLADEATLELFDDLLLRLHDGPVLILAAGQPSLFERRPAWRNAQAAHERIELGRMSQAQLAEAARDRLARVIGLPEAVPQLLARHAEGYPLTLVETLHYLADTGVLDASDGARWTLAAERLGELSLPTTIQGIVQARLDRLDDAARSVLGMAAVVGRTFWDGALAALTDEIDRRGIERALAALADRELIRRRPGTTLPGEQEYTFVENATQLVAYDMVRRSLRRELHWRHAEWLAERSRGDGDQALLARHFEQATAFAKALRAYARAGAYAASLGQNGEARHAYESACRIDDELAAAEAVDVSRTAEWAPPLAAEPIDAAERVKLRIDLGDVLQRLGDPTAAVERYEEARVLVAGDHAIWHARIDFRLAALEHVRGAIERARELALRAVASGAGLGDELAQMTSLLALLEARSGDHRASLACFHRAIRLCRAAPSRDARWRETVASLLRNLSVLFYLRGKLVRCERCNLQASRLLDERRQSYELARVLNNVGVARYAMRDLSRASEAFRRAFELAERSGDLRTTMVSLANLGEVEHHRGADRVARDYLLEARLLGDQLHAHGDVTEINRNLGAVHAALGDWGDAVAAASRALELGLDLGGRMYLPEAARTAADICRRAPAETASLRTKLEAVLEELDAEQAAACRALLG